MGMIARISGTVVAIEARGVIVDVGGVGYRVTVGGAVLTRIEVGQELTLRTYHHIKEDGQELYGFEEEREERYFKLLLTVPSVGARTARNILDVTPPDTLEQAVASEDVAALTKVSGVGKRTAERILVELKDKLDAPAAGMTTGVVAVQQETVEALVSLGWSQAQARKIAAELPKEVETVEEAVKLALKAQGAR